MRNLKRYTTTDNHTSLCETVVGKCNHSKLTVLLLLWFVQVVLLVFLNMAGTLTQLTLCSYSDSAVTQS